MTKYHDQVIYNPIDKFKMYFTPCGNTYPDFTSFDIE